MPQLFKGEDGHARCNWCAATDDYLKYHDTEWGFPVSDDKRLFEKICLEGFQAGLSWLTILNKRPRFRQVFCDFDFNQVAEFTEEDVERLLQDAGIVRHRGKIEATINNAKQAKRLVAEWGSLAAYFWSYEPVGRKALKEFPSQTEVSTQISKDLKKRGWKFVGPTTVYAFMQAMGLVNDHLPGCVVYKQVAQARAAFKVPVPSSQA